MNPKYSGVWKSTSTSGVDGDCEVEFEVVKLHKSIHTGHDVKGTVTINYKSEFRKDQTLKVPVIGKLFKINEEIRYIAHSDGIKYGQFFVFTLIEYKADTLRGFYSCVYPQDVGQMEIGVDPVKDFQPYFKS